MWQQWQNEEINKMESDTHKAQRWVKKKKKKQKPMNIIVWEISEWDIEILKYGPEDLFVHLKWEKARLVLSKGNKPVHK